MSRYGSAIYGLSRYGETPKLAYSVDPMSLLVYNFSETLVSWQIPSGTFSRVRLLRNQNGYAEHAEDGIIIWEEINTTVSRTSYRDGSATSTAIPIVPGKPIYYKIFLFTNEKVWVAAGSVGGVIPGSHDMGRRLVDALPRVFTSKEQSPLSEIEAVVSNTPGVVTSATKSVVVIKTDNGDLETYQVSGSTNKYGKPLVAVGQSVNPGTILATDSDLNLFLDGFAFSMDEALTYLDLLNPDHTLISTPESLIPLETSNFGLTLEPGIPLKNQKRLVREAIFMYTHKGTRTGIETYVESLSGYAPTITVSENLLLTTDESTFYSGTGNWVPTGATLASSTEQVPATNANNIDGTHTCKVIASAAGHMALGKNAPVTKAVPVTPGTTYTLSSTIKSPASAGNITPKVSFYTKDGTLIGSEYSGTATAATNTWSTISLTKRAPMEESQALIAVTGNGTTITYTTGANHTFAVGTSMTVQGFSTAGFNVTGATVTATTSNTFSVLGSTTGTITSENGYAVNNELDATYAAIDFAWSAAGTYYIDTVCLQKGSSVAYDEARALTLYLNPNKKNYIKNPSFEGNVTDSWTKTGSATVTQDSSVPTLAYSGTKSAKIVGTGAWTYTANSAPITPGSYYSASFFYKSNASMTLTFTGKDSGGTVIDVHTATVPISTDWARFSATDLVNYGESTTTYTIGLSGTTGTFYLDSVQFEKGPSATEYFDGSMPDGYGTVWESTANNSTSDMYFNKNFKVPRVGYTLKDWVPMNTFWRLTTSHGLEYTNLMV